MSDIVGRLRETTAKMALYCRVPMGLWQEHSTAVLQSADRIEQLERENAELRSLADDEQPRYTTKRLRYEVNRARSQARREALEEAAKMADQRAHYWKGNWSRDIAAAIRRLAEQEGTDAS